MYIGDIVRLGERIEYYPVFSEDNRELFGTSKNRRELYVDVIKALLNALNITSFKPTQDLCLPRVRGEYIHAFLNENVPEFYDEIETLIIGSKRCKKDEKFTFDTDRLLETFPNLKLVLCGGAVEIINSENKLYVLDPFDLGEMSFLLMQEEDDEAVNAHMKELEMVDSDWYEFWCNVAKDYYRTPEDHPEYPAQGMIYDGMDGLFKVYLLGWYSLGFPIEEEFKVHLNEHKDLKKAIELLPIRFQNCNLHEVSEKLYWDMQHIREDDNPYYSSFGKVLLATESLFPGVIDQMHADNWIEEDEKFHLIEMMNDVADA